MMTGTIVTNDISPFVIKAIFNECRSILILVVIEYTRPPNPEPAAPSPVATARLVENHCETSGSVGLVRPVMSLMHSAVADQAHTKTRPILAPKTRPWQRNTEHTRLQLCFD